MPIGGPRQVALLAYLLLHANRAVSTDTLVEEVWQRDGPEGAVKSVQVAVSRLRRALGDDRLRTISGGYLLVVHPGELDAEVFRCAVQDARRRDENGDTAGAAVRLRDALQLWRGDALTGVEYAPFAQAETRALEEERLAAIEARIDADLRLGRQDELIAELEALVAQYPTRERLSEHLMRALYSAGRQADALDVYRRVREHLIEELGLEPHNTLKTLQARILAQDPALSAGASAPRVSSPTRLRLPTPPNRTLGRERDLRLLVNRLPSPEVRLLSLIGAGGIGKTRLAVEVAHATAAAFPDGTWFAPLASVASASEVPFAVARVLDVISAAGTRWTRCQNSSGSADACWSSITSSTSSRRARSSAGFSSPPPVSRPWPPAASHWP
jgi:DNA-binding SARP family transcriptional activator